MTNIKVFAHEVSDGLEDAIKASASIAYSTELKKTNSNDVRNLVLAGLKAEAAEKDQDDLYYLDSILVTSCWNKNDDVFSPEEVWAARQSPEDKPFNLEHDEHTIIGHITGNWPIDVRGNILSEATRSEDLPETFHIVTSSVIYKHWTDAEYISRTEKLIAEIESGNKFVSMECLFTDFDYAVQKDDGTHHILERNENSAFLTKHLRAYGGTGEFQGYRIGRMLKNIAFCGHGLVAKPANPSSIIFDKYNPFNAPTEGSLDLFMSSSASDNCQKEAEMSDSNVNQIEELEASILELTQANEALAAELSEINEAHATAIEESKTAAEASATELEETKAALVEAEAKLAELEEAKAELQTKLDEIEAARIVAERTAKLTEAGLSTEEAEEAVAKFANLCDEQFDALAQMVTRPEETVAEEAEEVVAEEVAEEVTEEAEAEEAEEAEVQETEAEEAPAAEEVAEEAEAEEVQEEESTEVEASEEAPAEEDITEDEAEAAAQEEVLEEVEAESEAALAASSEEENGLEQTRANLSNLIAQKFLNI
jgi:hypothetical protein